MTFSDSPPADRAAEKAALRRAALSARAAISEADRRAAGDAIARLGAEIVARESPERVSLFFSVKGEIDTAPLAQALAALGVKLCLPVIVQKGAPLVFRDWAPGDPLEEKPFGLKEPPASATEVTPDLLFVPLAAFDATGARIGYGGGFYDRTLAKLRTEGRAAIAIGLAFAAQEIPRAPEDSWDEPLAGVLTERGFSPAAPRP